ncbi:MAG: PEP-CTERM sorting domain-containing protein [Nanoarchaeota archaeon]|nr:PEP-CTERM sorting domain-containing protein [Nanoarchaeota archaeon]
MYKKTIILIIVTVLLTITTANATIISSIPEPSSGSGCGSGPGIPGDQLYLSQTISFDKFSMTGNATWNGDNSYGNYYGVTEVDHGAFSYTWNFEQMTQHAYRNSHDPRKVYFYLETTFYATPYNPSHLNRTDKQTQQAISMNVNFPGIKFSFTSYVKNHAISLEDGTIWLTNDYIVTNNGWIEDGEFSRIGLYPTQETRKLIAGSIVEVTFNGPIGMIGAYTSGLEVLPSNLATQLNIVPEPTTITLLALGAISLLRRKNRK